MKVLFLAVGLLFAASVHAAWEVAQRKNPDGPGQAVDVLQDGKVVARLVHGEGQIKPYLHVFGEAGELLTNSGLGEDGKPAGRFPHHRGLFIGWKIIFELGTDDLWHMTRGCKMELVKLQKPKTTKDAATIVADIEWRSAKATNGSDLLIRETRTLVISRPTPKRTQVDASFALRAERDLRLAGDLQHSGVHFRAANEVSNHEKETTCLAEPEGMSRGNNLKWCRLTFPIGDHWYSALQLNAPTNPVEELSTRTYGRFGYFFKKALSKGEDLKLRYRFIIEQIEPPADSPKPSPEQVAKWREDSHKLYETFAAH